MRQLLEHSCYVVYYIVYIAVKSDEIILQNYEFLLNLHHQEQIVIALIMVLSGLIHLRITVLYILIIRNSIMNEYLRKHRCIDKIRVLQILCMLEQVTYIIHDQHYKQLSKDDEVDLKYHHHLLHHPWDH